MDGVIVRNPSGQWQIIVRNTSGQLQNVVEFIIGRNPKGSYHNSKPVKVGKPPPWGGGSRILPGFSHLEGGKWFLLGGVSKSTR